MADSSSTFQLFNKLPVEILSKILLYLNTYDVFQVSCSYPDLKYFTYDAVILRKVQLAAEFRFQPMHISEFLLDRHRRSLIVSLNINYNYWLTEANLRRMLKGLPNLQHLYGFDTKLPVLSDTSLKTVALTYRSSLTVPGTINDLHLHVLCGKFVTLKVLNTILLPGENNMYKNLNHLYLTAMCKTISKPNTHVYSLWSSSSSRELQISFINYIQMPSIEALFLNTGWTIAKYDLINTLHTKTFRLESLEMPLDPDSVAYEEVQINVHSVAHYECIIGRLFQTNLNLASLKRLTLSWSHCVPKLKCMTSIHLFKRPRYQPEYVVGSSILEMFIQLCPLIEELNITTYTDGRVYGSTRAITQLRNLQKLRLVIPSQISATFLVDVAKNCTNLTSLKVDLQLNDQLIIYVALPYMTSLKELVLRQSSIDMKRLFDATPTAKTIVRLALLSRYLLNLRYIENLLDNNPQFVFYRTFVIHMKQAERKYLNATLKKFKRNCVQYFTSSCDDAPEIHHDMFLNNEVQ